MMLTLLLFAAARAVLAVPAAIAQDAPSAGSAKVAFAGVNIAGFDFGCTTDGKCDTANTLDVVTKGSAIKQMVHFVKDDGFNAFRLPVGWQFLVNNKLGGPLDETNFAAYDKLVQGCTSSGAKMCMLDIHNYARYNGKVIAQEPDAPTNEQYTSLLSQLAMKYASVPQVAFDIMNEPHDIPDLSKWVNTTQAAVTAIRAAGAKNLILLPGTDYTSAMTFAQKSGPLLLAVSNPDGSKDGLIFNVHKYLDQDNSGTHAECASNNIDSSFKPLAEFLRQNKRIAMLTETGGGPKDMSCMKLLCEQNDFINQNSDVFKGVITWAAGGFDTDYIITERPTENGDKFEDQPLVTSCIVSKFRDASGVL